MKTEDEFIASSNHMTRIVKGKRTKRPRSSSPHTAATTAATITSSSSSACGGGRERERNMNNSEEYYGSVSSPATSSEVYQTTEEEDMAYCLILLAQGEGKPQPFDHDDDDENSCRVEKISSRKFFDVSSGATTTTNKAGFFVYECKTCNRSFPSFQALGGHRASHKKPKSAISDEEKKVNFAVPVSIQPSSIEDDDFNSDSQPIDKQNINLDQQQQQQQNPLTFSPQVSTNKGNYKSKIHECSICGSEFTSGQALGGHMRRHRANNSNNNNNINNQVRSTIDHHDQVKPRNILALDLNLPAPEDDHLHRESKFQFPSAQQALVFSAAALVDCYY